MHAFVYALQESVRELEDHDAVLAVQSRFNNTGANLAKVGRTILREGDLVKVSLRRGGEQKYRFFLFNDLLVYASTTFSGGKFKVHQVLQIEDMTLGFAGKRSSEFMVTHPVKSFRVVAGSYEECCQWVNSIEDAILEQKVRKRADSAHKQEEDLERVVGRRGSLMIKASKAANARRARGSSRGDVESVDATSPRGSPGSLSQASSVSPNVSPPPKMMMTPRGVSCGSGGSGEGMHEGLSLDSADSSPDGQFFASPAIRLTQVVEGEERESRGSVGGGGGGGASGRGSLSSAGSATVASVAWDMERSPMDERTPSLVAHTDTPLSEVRQLFIQALKFSRPVLEGTHARHTATDAQKLEFYGVFKQSTNGDCPERTGREDDEDDEDWIGQAKYEAWSSNRGLTKVEAKAKYIRLLGGVAPAWLDEAT